MLTDEVVRAHLNEVVRALRQETATADTAAVRRRKHLLDRLAAYADAGVFPIRPAAPRQRTRVPRRQFVGDGRPRQPRFVDDRGVACAVGHLMGEDRPDLVARIARIANDAFVLEMDDPEIAEWAAASGFSVDDLAWIQPNYQFDVPACEDYSPGEVDPVETTPVSGVDIAVSADRPMVCYDDCEGPVRVWGEVANLGDTASTFTVWLANDDGNNDGTNPQFDVLAEIEVTLEPGEWRIVGPLVLASEGDMHGFHLVLEAVAPGDVQPDNQIVRVLDIEGPHDFGPPGCADDDTGDTADDRSPRTGSCGGCGTSSPGAALAVFAALGGLALRSRARSA